MVIPLTNDYPELPHPIPKYLIERKTTPTSVSFWLSSTFYHHISLLEALFPHHYEVPNAFLNFLVPFPTASKIFRAFLNLFLHHLPWFTYDSLSCPLENHWRFSLSVLTYECSVSTGLWSELKGEQTKILKQFLGIEKAFVSKSMFQNFLDLISITSSTPWTFILLHLVLHIGTESGLTLLTALFSTSPFLCS